MACEICNHKGYILVSQLINNIEVKQARQCTNCNDIEAYSAYVKSKYSKLANSSPLDKISPPIIADENSNVIRLDVSKNKNKPLPKPEDCGLVLDLEEFRKKRKSSS